VAGTLSAVLHAWLAALAMVSVAPSATVQDPAPTRPAEWSIDPGHTLIWSGQPYTPFGRRIAGTVAEVDLAAAQGISDVMVELPVDGTGWANVIRALEAKGMRYLITINSLAPACRGVVVEPESYRVPGITAKRRVDARLPGAERALLVLASQRDGSVTETKTIPIRDGFLSTEVDPGNELPHVLLVYPLQSDLRTPDLWEGFDRHRDQLLATLRRNPAGPGLRGLVNPMGRLLRFASEDTRVVPVGTAFRLELEAYLRQRYTSVPTAARAWGIPAPDFDHFSAMARLVPLWSETRGIAQFWDPDAGRLYQAESRRGTVWADLQEVLGRATSRRYARLSESIRLVWNVPIVQEWRGWSGPYANPTVDLDGLTLTATGTTPALVADQAGPAIGSAVRRRNPLWIIADDLGSDGSRWAEQVSDTAPMGVRAWFTRGPSATAEQWQAAQAAIPAANRLSDPIRFLPYPESARNPVQTIGVGGYWLLPSPEPGNRIDYGTLYAGYRISDGVGTQTVLWSTQGAVKVVLRLPDPVRATVTSLDGNPVADAKVVKKGIQLTLTDQPIIVRAGDDIPVPEDAFVEVGGRLQALIAFAERRIPTAPEEMVMFKDRTSQFESAPGVAFLSLRQQYRRLGILLGSFTWIEAENTRQHTFSELASVPGTSQNGVLRLASRLDVSDALFEATYRAVPRQAGRHTVWVAARLPDEASRRRLRVRVGEQQVGGEVSPVGLYGPGYGWYRLGEVELPANPIEVTLAVTGSGQQVDLAVDVIVLTPEDWRPDGVYPPVLEVAPAPKPGR